MNSNTKQLNELFDRIPRRHTPENVKEIYSIMDAYEDVLKAIEAEPGYEEHVAMYFDELDSIRTTVKKSSESKNSKKAKDELFDGASGALKDTMESLMRLYQDKN